MVKNRWHWFRWGLFHLPGPSIFPKGYLCFQSFPPIRRKKTPDQARVWPVFEATDASFFDSLTMRRANLSINTSTSTMASKWCELDIATIHSSSHRPPFSRFWAPGEPPRPRASPRSRSHLAGFARWSSPRPWPLRSRRDPAIWMRSGEFGAETRGSLSSLGSGECHLSWK